MDGVRPTSHGPRDKAGDRSNEGMSDFFPSMDGTTDTVPIRSSAYDDDAKAIDIHIDDDRNPFQGSQSHRSTSLDTSLDAHASGSVAAEESSAVQAAEDAVWFSPSRMVHETYGEVDPNSTALCCVDFTTQERPVAAQRDSSQSLHSTTRPLASQPSSDPSENAASGSSSSTSSLPSSNALLAGATQAEYQAALPHPQAIFRAAELEWQVLIRDPEPDSSLLSLLPPPCEGDSTLRLWRSIDPGPLSSPSDEGRIATLTLPVKSQTDGHDAVAAGYVTHFDRYLGTDGSVVLSTQRGALLSIVPKDLLEMFREARYENPRVGVTGEQQFQDAAITLIRIVGNAANGETRGLATKGKLVSQKLGLDEASVKILEILGFRRKINEEDSTEQWFPPPSTSLLHTQRLLRATIELIFWYEHQCMSRWLINPQKVEAQWTTSPIVPKRRICTTVLESIYDVLYQHSDSSLAGKTSPGVREALRTLGASDRCTDQVVDYCYLCNSSLLSLKGQFKLFHALDVVAAYYAYKSSEVIETRLAIEKSKGLATWQELKQAYGDFNIDVDNFEQASEYQVDVIVDMFTSAATAAAADSGRVSRLKNSLELIAKSRNNPAPLKAALSQTFALDHDRASAMLDITKDTDDDFVGSAYQVAVLDARHTAPECQEALRVIAEHRQSAHLRRLYREVTGQDISGWDAPPSDLPAGLNNIGNTCYLNSVLQYFFAIKPLRERVLQAARMSQEANAAGATFNVAGRKIPNREVDRSMRFVLELAQLFSAMISSPVTAVTPERDLAYLALVSPRWEDGDTQDPSLSKMASEATASDETTQSTEIVQEPQHIPTTAEIDNTDQTQDNDAIESRPAGHVTFASPPTLPPRPLAQDVAVQASELGQRRNSLMQLGAQQDVSECLENVTTQVETALTAQPCPDAPADSTPAVGSTQMLDDAEWAPESDLLRRLFLGRTCQRVEVEDTDNTRVPSVHVKREVFKTLPVDVLEEGRDIYDGLDGFFDEEILEGPDGRPMIRTVTLTDAPAVLQIQLQRVQFDRVRGVFKSQANLEMGEVLYMDRYLDFDANDPADAERLSKRQRSREIRRTVAALRARIQHLRPTPSLVSSKVLSRTSDLLASLRVTKRPKLELDSSDDLDETEHAVTYPDDDEAPALDGALGTFLTAESQLVEKEIEAAEKQLADLKKEVEVLWSGERRIEYVLASVFMHRGEASHGHYFLNQRKLSLSGAHEGEALSPIDPSVPSMWYKYNDNVVQSIPLSQVLHDTTGATPYLVSFVRKDMQDDIGIFDTVCRQIDNGAPPTDLAGGPALQGDDDVLMAENTAPDDSIEESQQAQIPAQDSSNVPNGWE